MDGDSKCIIKGEGVCFIGEEGGSSLGEREHEGFFLGCEEVLILKIEKGEEFLSWRERKGRSSCLGERKREEFLFWNWKVNRGGVLVLERGVTDFVLKCNRP